MIPTLHPDYREFIASLNRHRVRYIVIGAYVLATLGRPRYSEDLDIFVEASPDNARRIADALREFGGYEELADAVPEHLSVVNHMISLGRPPVAIDVTTGIDGVTFDDAWAGRNILKIDSETVAFLGKREYVATKRAADRPKDRADLAMLQEAGMLDD